ncbi:MAG TPA: hypothetical protein VK463_18640 [Desulfomonilaceae bacterium]|nr:hypothetical protein [Desulfomonilaceae bacterium]
MNYRLYGMIALVVIGWWLDFSVSQSHSYYCGPASCSVPAAIPVCDQPIIPMLPCCEPSPLLPPPPPVVAPVIIGPAYQGCGPELPSAMPQRIIKVR